MAKKDNVFDSPMPFNISLVAPSIINRRHRKEEYSVSPDEIINALLRQKENSGVATGRISWWK